MTFEDIGLRKLKIDANIESIHIFNYISTKYPELWKEITIRFEANLIYTNILQKHKDSCLDKVRVQRAIESIESDISYAPSLLAFKKLRNILGIADK